MNVPQKPPNRLETQLASDLMQKQIPQLQWAVPGVFPEGLTVLAAAPKSGKSFLMLNVAFAVASGGVALGQIEIESEADVLYLALEDGERRIQDRLRKMSTADGKVPDGLYFAYHCPALDKGGLEMIEQWITDNPRAKLVVIDTFARVRQFQRGNTHAYTQDYNHVSPIKELADRHHVAIVLVHLTSKRKKGLPDDPIEAVSGTQGVTGAADAVTRLSRSGRTKSATLTVTGRDVPDVTLSLSFDAEHCAWMITDGAEGEQAVSPEREQILQFLREKGPSKPTDIAKGVGRESNPVRQLLFRMVNAGQLEKLPDGRYAHTPVTPVTPVTLPLVTPVTAVTRREQG